MSMETPGMPAGWYYAEGDAPGTKRYWDGSAWTSEPQVMMGDAAVAQDEDRFASGGRRIAGRIIDLVLLWIAGLILGPLVGGTADQQAFMDSIEAEEIDLDLIVPGAGLLLVTFLLYFLWDFLFTAFAGGTPGKLLLGMRVAEKDGLATPPNVGVALKRALNRVLGLAAFVGFAGFALGSLAGLLIGLVSLIFLFTDDTHRQTIMDKVAGTVVIRK